MGEVPFTVRVSAVALLFLIFMTGMAWAKTADEWYWRGYEYDALGNYDEAIKCYTQAINLKPDFPDAHYRLGLVYDAKEMFDQAIAQYIKLIDLDPDYADVYYNLGVAYDRKGSFNEAIAAYKKVVLGNNKHFDARKKLCSACANNGMLEEALLECRAVISINPTCAMGYQKLGGVYLTKGMYGLSVKHYYRAVSLYLKDLCKTVVLFLKSCKAVFRYLNFDLL